MMAVSESAVTVTSKMKHCAVARQASSLTMGIIASLLTNETPLQAAGGLVLKPDRNNNISVAGGMTNY